MAPSWKFKFDGRILFIGYGSVTRCTLPLIERHFDMPLSRVTVIDAEDRSVEIAPFVAKGVELCRRADLPQEHGRGARTLCRRMAI